jgi:hypothetical protein
MNLFDSIARSLGVTKILSRLDSIERSLGLVIRQNQEFHAENRGDFMVLTESIARLTALALKINEVVTIEKAQAEAKIQAQSEAIAAKDAAIDGLKAEVEALKAQVADPAMLDSLSAAIDGVENAAGAIAEIIKADNPTPITDLIVESIQSDPVPTPDVLVDVVVEPTAPTDGGFVASDAITDAVTEVVAGEDSEEDPELDDE